MIGPPGARSPRSRALCTMYRAALSLIPPGLEPSSLPQNPFLEPVHSSGIHRTGVFPTNAAWDGQVDPATHWLGMGTLKVCGISRTPIVSIDFPDRDVRGHIAQGVAVP